jgi:hypothetical protein
MSARHSARAPAWFVNGNRELLARSYLLSNANQLCFPGASELPEAFALSTTHDFIWLPASNAQRSHELLARKKLPGSNEDKWQNNNA